MKHSLERSAFSTTFHIKTIINGHGEEKIKVKELNREPDTKNSQTHKCDRSIHTGLDLSLFVYLSGST